MKYARMSSRKRYIAPGLLNMGVGTASSILTTALNDSAQRKQNKALLQQMWEEQRVADVYEAENYDKNGTLVEYLAKGGNIPSASSTSPIMGKYATKGGNLNYLTPNVAVAEGNTHGEKTIDDSYGITLFDQEQGGQPVAEVEDDEVVVDDQYVFSDRLKIPGTKQTYANKMKALTNKRVKLEKSLEEATSSRSKNTIERQLAGLNMAEETLMFTQETHKLKEGQKELDKLAYGGEIGDPPTGKKAYVPSEKAKRLFDTGQEDFLPIRKIDKVPNKDGSYSYDYYYDRLPTDEDYDDLSHRQRYTSKEHNAKQSRQSGVSYSPRLLEYLKTTKGKLGRDVGKLAYGGGIDPFDILGLMNPQGEYNGAGIKSDPTLQPKVSAIPSYIKAKPSTGIDTSNLKINTPNNYKEDVEGFGESGKDNTVFENLAPNLFDNLVNAGLTATSPKLAKPLLKKAANLETTVNVNPQLASISREVLSGIDNIQANTSNSNIARANMAGLRLKGIDAKNNVLAQKASAEIQLRNNAKLNRQAVDNANRDTMARYADANFVSQNDIQSRISGNVADFSKNVKEAQTRKDQLDYVDEVMLLDLLDDPTGEKVRTMARNPYLSRTPKLMRAILAERQRKAKI